MALKRSVVQILGRRLHDAQLLRRWYDAPPSFHPDQSGDASFRSEQKEGIVGTDHTGDLFQAARFLLLTYQYYPDTVMHTVSDFGLENRLMQVGDRILLRIHVVQVGALKIVDALALNRVVTVTQTDRQVAVAYVTTTRHSEVGIWKAELSWGPDDVVRIVVSAHSRAAGYVPWLIKLIARSLQKRAWRLGMAHFIDLAQESQQR